MDKLFTKYFPVCVENEKDFKSKIMKLAIKARLHTQLKELSMLSFLDGQMP